MKTYLGIDAGGTKTRAWLSDETGRIIGTGLAGAANPNNAGTNAVTAVLLAAAAEAKQAAGCPGVPITAAFVACAGIKTDKEALALGAGLMSRGLAQDLRVANDTEAALAGAFGGAPGIVLVCGTGSFCLGRNQEGRKASRGGWGWLLDDIGGAFWLGREAVRAVVLAADGRAGATTLSKALLKHFNVEEANELQGTLYQLGLPPLHLATLAPLVVGEMLSGDPVATRILKEAADGAMELARLVARELEWKGEAPLAAVGGVACAGGPFRRILETAAQAGEPRLVFKEPLLEPAAGATLLALQLGGIAANEKLLAQLSCNTH